MKFHDVLHGCHTCGLSWEEGPILLHELTFDFFGHNWQSNSSYFPSFVLKYELAGKSSAAGTVNLFFFQHANCFVTVNYGKKLTVQSLTANKHFHLPLLHHQKCAKGKTCGDTASATETMMF